MADSATGLDRGFDPAAYSPIPTNPAAPADLIRREHADAPSELAALIQVGRLKQESGNFSEAEECFRRALEMGEQIFGPENPDLIILLNDLTRLYLKQSAYGPVEPLLLRLLELKRSKGEDHPEVATVMATLATVKQALGMHESAEQLWRRVLEIRERTLAPNHFATASALEHLGDACAARGKNREALSVFERALTIREKTLGNEHPSLRIARERIADLQLQASEDMLDASFREPVPSPERYRLRSGDSNPPKLGIATTPTPGPQIRVTANAAAKITAFSESRRARDKKSTVLIPRTYTPPTAPTAEAQLEVERVEKVLTPSPSIERSSQDESGALNTPTVEYHDLLESVREDIEDPFQGETVAERTSRVFSSLVTFLRQRHVAAAITIVAVALLGVALANGKRASGESDQAVAQASAVVPPSALVASAQAQPIPIPVSTASITETSAAKTAKPRVAEDRSSAKRTPEKKSEAPARVSIPNLSTAVLSRLDSVAAKAAGVGSHTTDPVSIQANLPPVSQRRATFDDDQSNAPQRARLIGELPTPKVPPQVMDVEGEVRVRFNVDSLGRPVVESFAVVSSPNPLLTAAVRKVIPGMRFEPARTAGPDGKNIADVVQIGFQFARSR